MGTKKVILYLFILFPLNVLEAYSQNGYTEKIKWECKNCIGNVVTVILVN